MDKEVMKTLAHKHSWVWWGKEKKNKLEKHISCKYCEISLDDYLFLLEKRALE